MVDVTKELIKEALGEVLEERIDPLIRKIIMSIIADKFDKTLGVDCTDFEKRDLNRAAMVWMREKYLDSKTREGMARDTALDRIAGAYNFSIVWLFRVGLTALGITVVYVIMLLMRDPEGAAKASRVIIPH